ncbi:MAG: hypothetical protein QGG40_19420, partial [Myxococcota bacterium]|nr:hypothetical protein [Myxococcota bacterium]
RRCFAPFETPGETTESLFATLLAGAEVRGWLLGGGWGLSSVVDGAAYWPGEPLPAFLLAALGVPYGDARAWSLLVGLGLWGAGVSCWALARRLGADPKSALGLGGAVVLSPPLLQGVVAGHPAALGLGLVAGALATLPDRKESWGAASTILALAAGAWSWTTGAAVCLLAGLSRRWSLGVALVPLVMGLWLPGSGLPGGQDDDHGPGEVSSYVAQNLAVFPDPPDEDPAGSESTSREQGWELVWWMVIVGGVARLALVPWGGLAVLPVVAGLGLWGLPGAGFPTTRLAPEPVFATLGGLPGGGVVVFPSPLAPWSQGYRLRAEVLYGVTQHGHPVGSDGSSGLMARLTRVSNIEVGQRAAQGIWESRDEDPYQQAWDAGFRAILVDLRALNGPAKQRIHGELVGRVGRPLAVFGEWAVYGLGLLPDDTTGEGDAREDPEDAATPGTPGPPADPPLPPSPDR